MATCDNCEEEPATAECKQCQLLLCPDCGKEIHAHAKFRSHRLLPLGSNVELVKQDALCDNCEDEPASVWCTECQQALCTAGQCDDQLHRSHKTSTHHRVPLREHLQQAVPDKEAPAEERAAVPPTAGTIMCDNCEEYTASVRCEQCQMYLCDQGHCNSELHSSHSTRVHVRLPVGSVDRQVLKSSGQPAPPDPVVGAVMCGNCEEAVASVYCQECKLYLCGSNNCDDELHRPHHMKVHKRTHVDATKQPSPRKDQTGTEPAHPRPRGSEVSSGSEQQLARTLENKLSLTVADEAKNAAGGTSAGPVCDLCEDAAAALWCAACGQHLCTENNCDEQLHAPKHLHGHKRVPVSEAARHKEQVPEVGPVHSPTPTAASGVGSVAKTPLCALCEDNPAEVVCLQCPEEYFCTRGSCDAQMHKPAKLRFHLRVPLSTVRGDPRHVALQQCHNCEEQASLVYCPQCRAHLCGVCDSQLHAPIKFHSHTPVRQDTLMIEHFAMEKMATKPKLHIDPADAPRQVPRRVQMRAHTPDPSSLRRRNRRQIPRQNPRRRSLTLRTTSDGAAAAAMHRAVSAAKASAVPQSADHLQVVDAVAAPRRHSTPHPLSTHAVATLTVLTQRMAGARRRSITAAVDPDSPVSSPSSGSSSSPASARTAPTRTRSSSQGAPRADRLSVSSLRGGTRTPSPTPSRRLSVSIGRVSSSSRRHTLTSPLRIQRKTSLTGSATATPPSPSRSVGSRDVPATQPPRFRSITADHARGKDNGRGAVSSAHTVPARQASVGRSLPSDVASSSLVKEMEEKMERKMERMMAEVKQAVQGRNREDQRRRYQQRSQAQQLEEKNNELIEKVLARLVDLEQKLQEKPKPVEVSSKPDIEPLQDFVKESLQQMQLSLEQSLTRYIDKVAPSAAEEPQVLHKPKPPQTLRTKSTGGRHGRSVSSVPSASFRQSAARNSRPRQHKAMRTGSSPTLGQPRTANIQVDVRGFAPLPRTRSQQHDDSRPQPQLQPQPPPPENVSVPDTRMPHGDDSGILHASTEQPQEEEDVFGDVLATSAHPPAPSQAQVPDVHETGDDEESEEEAEEVDDGDGDDEAKESDSVHSGWSSAEHRAPRSPQRPRQAHRKRRVRRQRKPSRPSQRRTGGNGSSGRRGRRLRTRKKPKKKGRRVVKHTRRSATHRPQRNGGARGRGYHGRPLVVKHDVLGVPGSTAHLSPVRLAWGHVPDVSLSSYNGSWSGSEAIAARSAYSSHHVSPMASLASPPRRAWTKESSPDLVTSSAADSSSFRSSTLNGHVHARPAPPRVQKPRPSSAPSRGRRLQMEVDLALASTHAVSVTRSNRPSSARPARPDAVRTPHRSVSSARQARKQRPVFRPPSTVVPRALFPAPPKRKKRSRRAGKNRKSCSSGADWFVEHLLSEQLREV